MSNLSAINHKNFDKLHELTQNYNKAVFLDKCLFWWQISTYTLGDETIWFTRQINEMAKELNLSISSVNRYLKEFRNLGLIETKNKLYNKKHLYIRITEKLLQYINIAKSKTNECLDLAQDDTIENVNLRVSIYKEQDSNLINNNTVSNACAVNNFKTTPQQLIQSIYPTFAIEETIGERLSLREKNYIKGMMFNLQKQHQLDFSSPEQLFAEIAFSLLNEVQLQGVSNFNHRVQIIAKLLREKRWCTPKGFYNHCEFGAVFKKDIPKRVSQLTQPTSQSNMALEQQKRVLQSEFKAHNQCAFGEGRGLSDALEQVKTNPARWSLINASTKGLLASFEKQWTVSKELYLVDVALNQITPSQEFHHMKIINQHTLALSYLSQQIEGLAQVVFDAFCDLSLIVSDSSHLDALYEFYMKLNTLTKHIAKEILNLSAQIDLEFAA